MIQEVTFHRCNEIFFRLEDGRLCLFLSYEVEDGAEEEEEDDQENRNRQRIRIRRTIDEGREGGKPVSLV